MGLISDSGAASPKALLHENLVNLLGLLKNYLQAQSGRIPEETSLEITPVVCRMLRICESQWDFLQSAKPDAKRRLQLEIAVTCLEHCATEEQNLQLMFATSLYMNPYVPWSNEQLSNICMAVPKDSCVPYLSAFADSLSPKFLSVSGPKFSTTPTKRNTGSKFTKTRVARPALGLQFLSANEENERSTWKNSTNVTALSSVLMLLICDKTSQYASKCAAFILNVMDDPDPLFRAQGCFLLRQMAALGHGRFLARAGLCSVFEESIQTCLTYLPQLTPAEVSLRLLKDGAYPALFAILSMSEDTSYVDYLKVLDGHLLALITHVLGRNTNAPTNHLLAFFFSQISLLITRQLRLSVLACFSRLNYIICQTLVNPYLIESDDGGLVVEAAMRVHFDLLTVCEEHASSEPKQLLLSHKLDLLAAWAIVGKRMVNYGGFTSATRLILRENVSLARRIAESVQISDFEQDWEKITERVPELHEIFR